MFAFIEKLYKKGKMGGTHAQSKHNGRDRGVYTCTKYDARRETVGLRVCSS